jgi:hypothetical protein
MDTAAAFVISVGLIVFGVGIVYAAAMASGLLFFWTLIGLMPVAVGLMSLFSEMQRDKAER